MIIYKIANKINGKSYIGQTTRTLEKRINRHLEDTKATSELPIHRAIRKYGIQSFAISIIDTTNSKEILSEKEEYWISYLNTKLPYGYNMTDGGEGGGAHQGHKHSEISRKKLRDSHQGPKPWLVGKRHSKESNEKNRIAHLGHIPWNKGKKGVYSDETRNRIKNTLTGRHLSEEHKYKIKIGLKKHYNL